jgi:hypothetical protein
MRFFRPAFVGVALGVALMGQSLWGQMSDGGSNGDPFDRLHFRSIGPSIMSGRISDFAVYEANTAIFYVGTAHGGVWKTENNGATFTPIFEKDGLMSIGDVTVSQKDPNLVWVGTGEGNNRQSISWGDGIFKSTDGGKTWKNMGLAHSYHINRIAIDPNDNNIVFAAVQGNLFGPGGDRGLYRTTDGGATWKQLLKVDEDTGANEIVMDPTNSQILYASTYQRRRTQCCLNGGGPGSGIWKSLDGGDTWTRQTNGLPGGSLGRIGLDIYRKSPNILYAQIEAEAAAGQRSGGSGGNAPGESGTYRTDDGGASWRKVNGNDVRPIYFSQIRVDPNNPDRVITGGVRMYLSVDGGKTFNPCDPSEHDDKHALWWDPNNSNHILIGTDGGAYVSYDMTRSWIFYPNIVAGLFYHVGFDYDYPYNVCGGMQDNYDWCGPSAVRTQVGIPADRWQSIQGGDGFVAIIDARDSHIVYSETQDGALQRHNRVTGESRTIKPSAQNVVNATAGSVGCDAVKGGNGSTTCAPYRFNWDTPLVFAPTDPGVLYVAANHVFRSTDRGDSWTAISPDLTTNADRNDVVTMGVKGSDIKVAKDDGIAAWPTVVTFAESPKMPGLYYAGSDDGTVSMSKDAGKTWDKAVADRLPGFVKGAWTSKVLPSRYDAGTVYIASDAHRLGNYETHLWVSTDFGATFRSMNGNLQGEAIKTLTEDQRNPDVIYAGAETGLFVSLDRGKNWRRINANYPNVRTDEITLHPRDNAMLLATHGRAIWILDHLSPIQEYTAAQASPSGAKLFSIDPALEWKSFHDKNNEFWGQQYFVGENPPSDAVIQYFLKDQAKDVKLTIADAAGKTLRSLTVANDRLDPGIQTTCWDMRVEPIAEGPAAAGGGRGPGGGGAAGAGAGGRRGAAGGGGPYAPLPQPEPGLSAENVCGGGTGGRGGGGGGRGGGAATEGPLVPAGTYTVTLAVDGKTIESKPLKVVLDPAVQMTDLQQKRYFDMLMDLQDLQRRGAAARDALVPFDAQMSDAATKVTDSKAVPTAVKTQFADLDKDFATLRERFGVNAAGGGGRGGRAGGAGGAGGGGRAGGGGAAVQGAPGAPAGPPDAAQAGGGGGGGFGGGAPQNDIVSRVATVKSGIMAFSEMPSTTLVKQYDDVRVALPKAVADANAFLLRAMTMSQTLKKYDITLTVPAPIK